MKRVHYTLQNLARIKRFTISKKLLVLGLVIIVILLTIPLITYAKFASDIAERERLMNRKNTGFVLLDRNGEAIYSYGRVNYENDAKLSEVSDHVERALVASEDEEFYEHDGYSTRGIAGALFANLTSKDLKRYGGSTITQQLVKNNLLTTKRSFLRKYQELSMAIAVENRYSKDEILEMYLNSVYFGEGAFGISAASKTYFNKSPQDLNLAESSMLIGLLPAPTAFSPISGDKEKAKQQQRTVLERMVSARLITQEEADSTFQAELKYDYQNIVQQNNAHHFAIMVLEELKDKYGEETIVRGGYRVTTSLDLNWQRQAEQIVSEQVARLSSTGATNAGLVAIDPKTGEVRAMVGSVNWDNPDFGKVNMALAPRQPGSSFKPIYYTEAFDKRIITPATILKDEPKSWDTYRPQNFDFKFRGDISVRNALGQSLNIPSVEIMQKLGVKEASQAAQRMGISSVTEPDKYGLSLALGTAEVKLLEMTNAYAAFANQGEQFSVSTITGIKDKFDRDIYSHKSKSRRVVSKEASFLISSILSDQQARAPTFGRSLTIDNRDAAVKTGTTDDSRDAWTIGYTPSLTVGIWVGNNENQPMRGIAGSSSAGQIWRQSIKTFLGDSPKEEFVKPEGIIELDICKGSGLRASHASGSTYKEFFIKGSEPTETCRAPKKEPKKEVKKEEDKKEPEKKEEEPKNEENNTDNDPGEAGGRGGGGAEPDEEDADAEPENNESTDPVSPND